MAIHDLELSAGQRTRGRPRAGEAPNPQQAEHYALRSFAAHGYDGASMRDIATAAGIDPALLSRRYGSKMGLWRATVNGVSERLERVYAEMRDIMDAPGPSASKVPEALRRFVEFNATIPDLACFFIDEITRPGERREYIVCRIWLPYLEATRPIIAAAGGYGSDSVAAGFSAFSLLGLVVLPQLMAPILDDQGRSRPDDTTEQIMASLMRQLHMPVARCSAPDPSPTAFPTI